VSNDLSDNIDETQAIESKSPRKTTRKNILPKKIQKEEEIEEFDLIQIYTKGNAKRKETELIFVNHRAQSFFMNGESFLDLLEHIDESRLVKKYTKKKKAGYIGGEVLGCVHDEGQYYQFIIVFGPQDQIIDSQTRILDRHIYNIVKDELELYAAMLRIEESNHNQFVDLLKEADHNVQRRFSINEDAESTIDLGKCLRNTRIKQ
jgi:hypothetical protein